MCLNTTAKPSNSGLEVYEFINDDWEHIKTLDHDKPIKWHWLRALFTNDQSGGNPALFKHYERN